VRALLTSVPAYGHFTPLVPLGRALSAAGHTVGVATNDRIRGLVERENFEFVAVSHSRIRPVDRKPTADNHEALMNEFLAMFVSGWAATFLASADTAIDWAPDVLIREEGEFGAPVLAAELGIPCVDVGWGPARPPALVTEVGEAMEALWRGRGLQPDPLNGTYEWLYVDPCPPSLQAPYASKIATRHRIRPVSFAPARGELPDWLVGLDRPAVYVTLGTAPTFADDVPFFAAAIAPLVEFDLEVIVTMGPDGDPDALGPQPPQVHVERFIPQAAVLPHCIAAITNGGSGATMGALAHGVPVLVVSDPRSPSQVRNGEAVAAIGAGRSLARAEVTPQRLHDEIHALLSNASYRDAAVPVAAEIADMPEPPEVVAAIEHVVTTGRSWCGGR
jgi:UDP:flavonoid glycosyltransferase YjiC (YdhE family)